MRTLPTPWMAMLPLLWLLSACVSESDSSPESAQIQSSSPSELAPMVNTSGVDPGHSEGESGFIGGGNPGGGAEQGYVAPVNLLFCGETGQIVLKRAQRTLLTWAYPNGYVPPMPLTFNLEATPATITEKGAISPVSNLSAWYDAPATVPVSFEVQVRATLGDATTPAVCKILLISDAELGIEDDGASRGLVGNVYVLPVNQPKLPDFSLMTPVASILVPNFDVPQRSFDIGFPGVPDLFEWFGIRFEGRLVVPETGSYDLRITSDDGSILWVDGVKVIDNDGVHAPVTKTSTVTLTAGNHPFRLDYYQGPRYLIALQLLWKKPGDAAFTIIPPDAFLRPN